MSRSADYCSARALLAFILLRLARISDGPNGLLKNLSIDPAEQFFFCMTLTSLNHGAFIHHHANRCGEQSTHREGSGWSRRPVGVIPLA